MRKKGSSDICPVDIGGGLLFTRSFTLVPKKFSCCPWAGEQPIYLQYHDHEWGKVNKNSAELFELLCLEGQQAGLSWITVLNKRAAYRKHFYQFDAEQIAQMDAKEVALLIKEPSIIRNQAKILAIITNAKAYLRINNNNSFSDFVWETVQHHPIINHWQKSSEVPAYTTLSEQLAKKLKKAGFKFVGPTICYAFMQACGMVNDHLISCFCHPEAD